MSDRAPHRTRAGLAGECLFAAGLGLLLLATGVWQRASDMGNLSSDWSGLANLMGLRMGGTPLGTEVSWFVVAQLALHLCFGLLAWLLAWLTQRVASRSPMRQLWLIAAWFAALTAWVLIANATLFPWSRSGIPSQLLGHEILGAARLFEICSLVMLSVITVLLFLNARAVPMLRRSGKRIAVYGVLVILVVVVTASLPREQTNDAQAGGPPNIFLIGIDSLRGDVVGGGERPGITPNVDAFVRDGAQMFTDAITPLARTFPSWTAILSGRTPRSTGARDNLIPFATLQKFDTIARVAQHNGYHTVFATDEVRFSNIDASFGFDEVITPTIGTADFLLGKFNDLPLSNLVANTWLGRRLFPATFANRAAAVTYEPDTFVDWVSSHIESRALTPQPTMMAVHFTLPHAPYSWAVSDQAVFGDTADTAYQYSRAVIAADRQFGQLMQVLERKGLLRNAMVVFLSDHGEALGLPDSDSLLRGAVARDMLDGQRISLWGHGSSVLSPHQYSAVLAMRGYGTVNLPGNFREHDVPVSLIDVAPTVIDLAGLKTDARFDGVSLLPAIAGDARAIEALAVRPRFTETGIRTRKLEQGDFDERSVLGDVATFFRMEPVNGRLELRPELMPELLADKERAAITRDWLLASVPSRGQATQKYIFVNRRSGGARRLEVAPEPGDTQVFPLWQALHEHFAEELLPPAPRSIARPGAN